MSVISDLNEYRKKELSKISDEGLEILYRYGFLSDEGKSYYITRLYREIESLKEKK